MTGMFVTGTLAIIGIGHLAEYIVQGLCAADPACRISLLARSTGRAQRLVEYYPNTELADDHQAALDEAETIIVATRPDDVVPALNPLRFATDQTVISVAAGVGLAQLSAVCAPASAVRSLPLSCVRIHRSPTLVYPDHAQARRVFGLLGSVHTLEDESQFAAASAITGALYAWLFALMGECQGWAERNGLPPRQARVLVQDTFAGAVAMGQDQTDHGFDTIWSSLATPAGISELGHRVITGKGGFAAFDAALTAVRDRLNAASA